MAANAEIFFEHDRWGRNLAWSAALHIAIAASIILYAVFGPGGHGGTWGAGGGGDAMGVTLVNSVPLPARSVQTQNVLANESKGLTQSLPKTEEKAPEAIPIPDKNAKTKPKPRISESHQKAQPQPVDEASNVVPFGEGGPVSGPYGSFAAGGAKAEVHLAQLRRRAALAQRQQRPLGRTEDQQVLVVVHAIREPEMLAVECGRA